MATVCCCILVENTSFHLGMILFILNYPLEHNDELKLTEKLMNINTNIEVFIGYYANIINVHLMFEKPRQNDGFLYTLYPFIYIKLYPYNNLKILILSQFSRKI